MSRVWIVLEGDYNSDWVAAVYSTEALADAHVKEVGGWVTEAEVLDSLVSEVTDSVSRREEKE